MERYNLACVVNIRHRDHSLLGTCCGILVDTQSGLVLAHASCLASCLDKDGSYLDEPHLKSLRHLYCEIFLEQIHLKNEPVGTEEKDVTLSHVAFSNIQQLKSDLKEGKSGGNHTQGIKKLHQPLGNYYAHSRFSAILCGVFKCQLVAESLDTLMSESTWELVDRDFGKPEIMDKPRVKISNDDRKSGSEDLSRSILSSFVLFRINHWTPYLTDLRIRKTSQCCIGDKIEIISTPFGGLKPDVFMNSVSRGVVSNIAGSENCLLLTDARCIWGGEGSPLYTFSSGCDSQERFLTAVIIASLCWKSEEWVGFSLACDIGAILHSIPPHLLHLHNGLADIIRTSALSVESAKGGLAQSVDVVLVKMGPTWGSGVVINRQPTVILTCSHVIKDSYRYQVQIKRAGKEDLETVEVVHQQLPLKYPFDMAILHQPSVSADLQCRPSTSVPREGMEVFVIGHALFGPELNLQPSVTTGVISKVIHVNDVPVMIQTTCAVHPGASGGALVDTRGRLIGIVVCNARDTTTGASFPHVNMSIPVCTVWPLIEKFLDTQEVQQLKALTIRNKTVNAIWSLEPVKVSGDKHRRSKL